MLPAYSEVEPGRCLGWVTGLRDRPLSARRLRRMLSHLRWLLRFQGADARKAEAREHWREDLAWMRTVLGPVVAGPGL